MSQVLRLGWGPGPGDRMLSPGLPDLLFSDGAHLGWVTRDGAYALMEEAVHLVSVPDPTCVSISPGCWVLAQRTDSGVVVTRFNPREPAPERWTFPVRSVVAGSSWAVLDHGVERSVVALDGEVQIPIPAGATDAHPQPWSDRPGLVWVQEGVVYRMGEDRRIRVAGTLPSQPSQWCAGPAGAALFCQGGEVWGMGPGTAPRPMESLDWEGLRFAPSGERVLGATETGVEERCLRTGQLLWSRRGHVVPVGFGPDPILLEERTGRVHDTTGTVFASGFNPCAAARVGHRLYGPGGTAWDLEEGVQHWQHAPLHAEHLAVLEDRVVAIAEDMRLYDLSGEPCGRLPLPLDLETEGAPIHVEAMAAGSLLVELEDSCFALSLSGKRTPLRSRPLPTAQTSGRLRCSGPDEVPCLTQLDGSERPLGRWPIGADDAAIVDDRVWCWSEDGMLCALEPFAQHDLK